MKGLLSNIEGSSFLFWVVGLMAVAVSILILFQYRWVNSVLQVNEKKFNHEVREALNHVSHTIERNELKRMAASNFGHSGLIQNNSTQKTNQNKTGHDTVDLALKNFQFNMQGLSTGTNVQIRIGNQSGYRITSSMEQAFQQQFELLRNRSQIIDEVFQRMLHPEEKIEKRVDNGTLDSLIKNEFSQRGINLKYNYGVLNRATNSLVPELKSNFDLKPKEAAFSVALFPNDLNGSGNLLLVTFPNRAGFLLQKMWLTLSSSAMLILVIIFCFGYAIYTILQQKKLSEMKTDFINNMTHEFKTPIATISLACEALSDKDVGHIPEIKDQYIGIIEQENRRLGLQVEKVLQIAMIEKDKLKLNVTQVAVKNAINASIDNLQLKLESKSGKIKFDNKLEEDVYIEADEVHLTNAFNNLLDNAIKYSPEEPEIAITLQQDTEGVYVSVSDKGLGMTQEAQAKVFDKFYRVSTGNIHNVKGFGLGLAYVKYVVDAHQGNILLTSTPNVGSTFEIYLPYQHVRKN